MSDQALAIDIGGTKIAVGLVGDDGSSATTLSCRRRRATPRPSGRWSTRWSPRRWPPREVTSAVSGIASAGPIDLPRHRQPDQHHEWQRFPIVERVTDLVGAPARLGGDGLCMAMGERWRGAGRGAQFMLGMVVSTGVGGGLVLDGAPYDGRTGNAGTSATSSSSPTAQPCTCGGRGCVETIASGPNMARWAREQRLGRAARSRRQGARRRRQRRRPVGAQGVPTRGDRRRGDDRLGGGGLRPRSASSSAGESRSRERCCSTRSAKCWPCTRA